MQKCNFLFEKDRTHVCIDFARWKRIFFLNLRFDLSTTTTYLSYKYYFNYLKLMIDIYLIYLYSVYVVLMDFNVNFEKKFYSNFNHVLLATFFLFFGNIKREFRVLLHSQKAGQSNVVVNHYFFQKLKSWKTFVYGSWPN